MSDGMDRKRFVTGVAALTVYAAANGHAAIGQAAQDCATDEGVTTDG
jgi:hypothetical protein